jgi:predicted flap endonuclease-1-like 5' DNA nuclease
MKTIIIASLFCMDNFWPILLGLLGAALLGYLLKQFMGGSSATTATVGKDNWETKYNTAIADLQKEKERSAKLSSDNKNKKSNNNAASAVLGTAVVAGATAAEVENLQSKIRGLKEEVKEANEAKLKVQAEVSAANLRAKEATTINSELETAKVRIDGLSRALDAAKLDADKYKVEFDNANGERTRLIAQLNSSEVGAMQKRIDKLENDLDSARMTTSNLQVELDRAKNGTKTISNTIVAKPESANTKDRVIELEKELTILKANQDRVDKATELNKLTVIAAVNEANSKTNAELIDLRNKLKSAESTITKLENDKTKLAMAVGSTSVKAPEVEPIIVVAAPVVEAPKVEEVKVEEAKVEEAVVEVAAPTEAATPIVEEAPVAADDLTVVEGIGPKIAELINNAGITTYASLADTSTDKLQSILDDAGERYRVHKPGTWPEQAALLRDGKMDEFKALCDELDGGVRVEKSATNAETEEEMDYAKAHPDDLKVLEGVGPVLEGVLNNGGIYTYKQLAAKEPAHVKAILEASGDMLHNPDSWPQQAALLRDGKMDEFNALCDSLKGGIA